MKNISFAKSQKTPKIASDTLRSEDSAELVIGLCEGPISGLENGEKSFFLDDTPLINEDGSKNFSDYDLDIKLGDPSQDEEIKLKLGGVARATNVGVELKHNEPITRTTQTGDIDYLDIRVMCNLLYWETKSGSQYASSVKFKIEYKPTNSQMWTTYRNEDMVISGKTTSQYSRDYRVPVPRLENTTYDIRLTKTSENSPESGKGYYNSLYFQQFEEVVAKDYNFENTAIAHINVSTSDQFSQLPSFSGIYKGLVVKVPSNYNPENRTYNGEWDGTFKMEWTDNPAWCLYDLLVNDRYGVNSYWEVLPDKYDFYEAGQFCDELVDDGKGGVEPRYTLNIVISEAKSGPEMLNYIASIFNATIYEDATGYVRLSYDRNRQAKHIFSPENVTAAGFNYSFTDPSTRYNEVSVTFVNPNLNWSEDRRQVKDDEQIELYGRITEDFQAVGCTKESEAIRRARYHLLSSVKEVMSVSFVTNRAGQNIDIFDTILVADPNMQYSQSGRIKSVSEDRMSIKLRDPVFIEAGSLYGINLQLPDGVVEMQLDVKEYGEVKTLYLNESLPINLPEKAVFSLTGSKDNFGSAKPFKVISIAEGQDDIDTISINAIEIYRNKQYEADTGYEITTIDNSTMPSSYVVPHIIGLSFSEYYVKDEKQTQLVLTPELDKNRYPFYSNRFYVYSRLKEGTGTEDDNYDWQVRTLVDGDTIINHPAGDYEFIVLPSNVYGSVADFDTAPIFECVISDLSEPPADVWNFIATPNINNVVLTWDKVQDADLIGYEIRIGEDWETGDVIASYLTDNRFIDNYIGTDERKYMIKAIDVLGNYSVNYAYNISHLSAPSPVRNFYVTPSNDNLRFDWSAETGNGVEFEVRAGADWDSGITLFRVKGTNNTILNPGISENGYMIKAVSASGVYSEEFRYALALQELKQDRNVIMEIDNASQGWQGVSYGLEDTQFDDVKAMSDGIYFAEHFFKVELPEVIRARNWFTTEGFKFGSRLTFEDLDYMWGSEEAAKLNWLNSSTFSEIQGTITPVITYKIEEPYLHNYGFTLNETLVDYNNTIAPAYSYKVYYANAHFSKGLVLNKVMEVRYDNVNVFANYTVKFRVKMTSQTSNYFGIFRLSNASNTNWIQAYVIEKELFLERSDGVILREPFTRFENQDYLHVMVSQSDTKLSLDYSVEYANITSSLEVEAGPIGGFTKLYFGGNYD